MVCSYFISDKHEYILGDDFVLTFQCDTLG